MSSFTYPISKKQLNDLYHDSMNQRYKALITRIVNDISRRIILAAQNGLNKITINNFDYDDIGIGSKTEIYTDITIHNIEDILVNLKERFPDNHFSFKRSETHHPDLHIFPIIIRSSWE
jgi:hypothetical protein